MKTIGLLLVAMMALPVSAKTPVGPAEGSPAVREIEGKLPARVKPRSQPAAQPAAPAPEEGGINLIFDISAKYLSLEGTARFITANASQANHVTGGDEARKIKNSQGEGVEFKKYGFICNVLPALDPNDPKKVVVQAQVELSGPVPGIKVGENDVPHIKTWQYQGEYTALLGKKIVLVEAPARLEITVTRAE